MAKKGPLRSCAADVRSAAQAPTAANLVISNAPGSSVPLYLASAKFLSFKPTFIVTHGSGLEITLKTHARRVDFCIIADEQVLPHASEVVFAKARGLMAH